MQEGTQTPPAPAPAPQSGWTFNAGGTVDAPLPPKVQPVQWTASEFIAHDKAAGWYVVLGLVATIAAGATLLITRDKITAGMVVIVAVLFGVMAARKPRELSYEVNDHGIQVGDKMYPYAGFKSFSIVRESGIDSIWFLPLQRFKPGLSIYFAPQDEDAIANTIAQFLPIAPRELDAVDKLMHRIHF